MLVMGARGATGYVLGRGAGASNWWEAGGATGIVAAYQPKGAASLAASYVNLANPGVYNAAPGTAPTWDASGWSFNGSDQWLDTGYAPQAGHTGIIRFANAVRQYTGMYADGIVNFAMAPLRGDGDNKRIYYYGGYNTKTPGYTNCVLAIAGMSFYLNGSPDGGTGSSFGANTTTFGLGRRNGSAIVYYQGDICAASFYNTTLSAAQVAAVTAAMAAL